MRAVKTADATPTPPEVARAATEQARLPRADLALIGVSAGPGRARAILRTPEGRVRTVAPGDRVAGERVAAIDAKGVILERAGRTRRIGLAARP